MGALIGVVTGFVTYGLLGVIALHSIGPQFAPYKYLLLVTCLVGGSIIGMLSEERN